MILFLLRRNLRSPSDSASFRLERFSINHDSLQSSCSKWSELIQKLSQTVCLWTGIQHCGFLHNQKVKKQKLDLQRTNECDDRSLKIELEPSLSTAIHLSAIPHRPLLSQAPNWNRKERPPDDACRLDCFHIWPTEPSGRFDRWARRRQGRQYQILKKKILESPQRNKVEYLR